MARQWLYDNYFQGDPGVCSQGSCVSRSHCTELCGRAVGEALGTPIQAELQACYAKGATAQWHLQCREEQKKKLASGGELIPRISQCLFDCGFERPVLPEIPP